MKCHKRVEPQFFCPTDDFQGQQIQSIHSQWCLECIGRMIQKYPCSECLELLKRDQFDDAEFRKGMKRECKECSDGPPSGLRDSDFLFKKRFECWQCSKEMNESKQYTCKSCQRPTYCGRSCQKKHWLQHRDQCQKQTQIAKRLGLLKDLKK